MIKYNVKLNQGNEVLNSEKTETVLRLASLWRMLSAVQVCGRGALHMELGEY